MANGYGPTADSPRSSAGMARACLRLLAFVPAPLEAYDERLRPGFGVREFRESP